MQFVRNTPEQAQHIEDGRRLEREAEEAARKGNEARARILFERAELCYELVEAERREAARKAAARVSLMETPGIMTGHEGESVLDD